MNREIKFRVWVANQMFYKNNATIFSHSNVPKISIMQYTGLKDKEGKEVYEGDIISWMSPQKLYPSADFIEQRGVVYFNEENSAFHIRYKEFPCYSMEIVKIGSVIGNIYENKELLS